MRTNIRKLDGLPIEEPVLDEKGQTMQGEFSQLAMREYAETGRLTGRTLRETAEQYETEIAVHAIMED